MPRTTWELRLSALTLFIAGEGREPSTRASVAGERRLALWLQEQRHAARGGRLTEERLAALRNAALLGDGEPRSGAVWLKVASVSEFIAEEGRIPSFEAASSAGEKRLAAWLRSQLSGPSASTDVSTALHRILADTSRESQPV